MNLRRLMLAASCRDNARGPMARRASAEGDFVKALSETDRLLRINPDDRGPACNERARERIIMALENVDHAAIATPTARPTHAARWRAATGTALLTAAAAAVVLAPLVIWDSARAPAPAPVETDQAIAIAESPRLSWTLVADFDRPLRSEAAALAADVRRFGHMIAPGVMGADDN